MNSKQIINLIETVAANLVAGIKKKDFGLAQTFKFDIAGVENSVKLEILNNVCDDIAVCCNSLLTAEERNHLLANYRLVTMYDQIKKDAIVCYAPPEIIKEIKKEGKDSIQQSCDECNILHKSLFKCGGCKIARYCGDVCAKKAWKSGHKEECKCLKQNKL